MIVGGEGWFFIDSFNVFLVTLTAFVAFTTALFSRPYMRIEQEHGRLNAHRLRLYHSSYQIFIAAMLLALTTNNMGILWVSMEAATLATVLLVSLYRTPASLEAAWKYFILCGVGIAQALFGTILLYFAAEKVLGSGGTALLWTHLNGVKAQLEPTVLQLAFVFLLVGYGTKVGLAPLHNWLPDAHAEGPTPVSAVLSGLLLNVALYAVMRSKVLVDGALGNDMAGNLMMGFGLLSVVLAAFLIKRQTDVKRMFAYSSIEHMGLITFAFGMGGAVANFAASAAHDHALADQVGHLLRRRPCHAKRRHAADGRHPRPDQDQPDHRLGPDAGHRRHPRRAALRRLRQRIPDHHHGHARASLGDALPAAGAGRRLRLDLRQGATHGVRRDRTAQAAVSARPDAGVHASGPGAHARPVHSALSGRLVSSGRRLAGRLR
jgi:hypothetical protein